MHGVLADAMAASDTGEDRVSGMVLNEAVFAAADRAHSTKATRKLCSLLAKHTGTEAWSGLHANSSRRAFCAQRECAHLTAVKDAREEEWKNMKTELAGGAKIPDLDMSAWPEVCLKDVKDQMLIRLNEIGEDYENLKTKVDVLFRLHVHDSRHMLVQVS